MTEPVLAFGNWKSNAELILACRDLGYLDDESFTLDCTYGMGAFWGLWAPRHLLGTDIDHRKSQTGESIDFTRMPYPDCCWHNVVFDPPYRLNGKPDLPFDSAFGIETRTRWQDRMELIRLGVIECSRVLGDGYLLCKIQDQVVSGAVRWQTIFVAETAEAHGLQLWDRLDMQSYRPQPEGRAQRHARSNSSTMLIFKRGSGWRP